MSHIVVGGNYRSQGAAECNVYKLINEISKDATTCGLTRENMVVRKITNQLTLVEHFIDHSAMMQVTGIGSKMVSLYMLVNKTIDGLTDNTTDEELAKKSLCFAIYTFAVIEQRVQESPKNAQLISPPPEWNAPDGVRTAACPSCGWIKCDHDVLNTGVSDDDNLSYELCVCSNCSTLYVI